MAPNDKKDALVAAADARAAVGEVALCLARGDPLPRTLLQPVHQRDIALHVGGLEALKFLFRSSTKKFLALRF